MYAATDWARDGDATVTVLYSQDEQGNIIVHDFLEDDGGACPQDKTGACAIHGGGCSNVNVLKSNYGHWSLRQKGAWYRHHLERA